MGILVWQMVIKSLIVVSSHMLMKYFSSSVQHDKRFFNQKVGASDKCLAYFGGKISFTQFCERPGTLLLNGIYFCVLESK